MRASTRVKAIVEIGEKKKNNTAQEPQRLYGEPAYCPWTDHCLCARAAKLPESERLREIPGVKEKGCSKNLEFILAVHDQHIDQLKTQHIAFVHVSKISAR